MTHIPTSPSRTNGMVARFFKGAAVRPVEMTTRAVLSLQKKCANAQWRVLSSQRGAMFGLDARIALAIFGTLSIVITAVSVNHLGNASVTALQLEMKSFSEAYKTFVIDTGTDTNRFTDLLTDSNNIFGWSGPYLTIASTKHPKYGEISLTEGREDVNGTPPAACSGGGICSVWVKVTGVPDTTAGKLDESFDGVPGSAAGNLRIEAHPGEDDVYYKLTRKQ